MRTRTDYKICVYCGASLDVGERCDCTERPRYNNAQVFFSGGCKALRIQTHRNPQNGLKSFRQ